MSVYFFFDFKVKYLIAFLISFSVPLPQLDRNKLVLKPILHVFNYFSFPRVKYY